MSNLFTVLTFHVTPATQQPHGACFILKHDVMFTFHSRFQQRKVFSPWHDQIMWCSFSMAGSNNVMFPFHGKVKDDIYTIHTRVMFTYHGKVR